MSYKGSENGEPAYLQEKLMCRKLELSPHNMFFYFTSLTPNTQGLHNKCVAYRF